MNRLFKLQFLGPFALFAATLSAELAARALQYAPSSEFLWFLNLKMFGIFQRSDAVLSYLVPIDGFQLFGLALPIFVVACLGLAAKCRPAFTVATHLSVVYALFLVVSWHVGVPTVAQASLGAVAIPAGGQYVMATILGTCFLSFAITHLLYFWAVGKEIGALVRAVSKIFRTSDHARDHHPGVGRLIAADAASERDLYVTPR
ncbi:MAG: hypothetical protein Q7N95_15395 [Alphaproteobacteria bacterium]|nr:hypothetical protein [Alphaproteobacteria bacterium]